MGKKFYIPVISKFNEDGTLRYAQFADGRELLQKFDRTMSKVATCNHKGHGWTADKDCDGNPVTPLTIDDLIKGRRFSSKRRKSKEEFEYDDNGNISHYHDGEGFHYWCRYDKNHNETQYRDSKGFCIDRVFDENNKLLSEKRFRKEVPERFRIALNLK